jgi:hypothetical protein
LSKHMFSILREAVFRLTDEATPCFLVTRILVS